MAVADVTFALTTKTLSRFDLVNLILTSKSKLYYLYKI